jgi:hypothetical protein
MLTSMQNRAGRAGVRIVARNEGEVLLSSSRVLFDCSSKEEAEVLACWEGLQLALQWITMPIILEQTVVMYA